MGRNLFLYGTAVGLAVAASVYYIFSFVVLSGISDAAVSGITLLGIGFAAGGYLVRWRGDTSGTTYFVIGVGIGIIIVSCVGAGAGVSPYIGS